MGNIESGARQAKASLIDIEEAVGVSYKWLAEGQGAQFVAREPTATYLAADSRFVRVRRVSLQLQAGVNGFAIEPTDDDGTPLFFSNDWLDKKNVTTNELGRREQWVHQRGRSAQYVYIDNGTVTAVQSPE